MRRNLNDFVEFPTNFETSCNVVSLVLFAGDGIGLGADGQLFRRHSRHGASSGPFHLVTSHREGYDGRDVGLFAVLSACSTKFLDPWCQIIVVALAS